MKRILGTVLVLAMLLSMLAVPALADEPLELTMFFPVNVGGAVAQLIDNMTNTFNEQNPGIKVNAVYTGNYDDTVTAIQTAISPGLPSMPVKTPVTASPDATPSNAPVRNLTKYPSIHPDTVV